VTTFTLRDYQQEAVDASMAYLRDRKMKKRNGVIVAPTGSGKSLLIASIATQLDAASIVFQPSKEILQQNANKLAHYGYPASVFSASMGRRERLVLNNAGTDYTDGSVQLHFTEIGFVGRLCDVVAIKLAQGRKHILVFTRFVDEARRVAAQFPGAAYVTGETPDREREAIVRGFTDGTIPVVANVGVFSVGFDAPVIDCIVLGRPSVSLATYYQQVGRAVRPHASKLYADIVDMVGLTRLFGHVEDLQLRTGGRYGREWTVCSGDRALTDRYFSERDSEPETPLSPEELKKKKRADFWRNRKRQQWRRTRA